MAKYNITANGNQLVITLIVTDQDFSPNIRTFKTPSIKLTPFTIKFMEDGFYKMALNFNEINEIGGVMPTDLNDAVQLIINLTETPSTEYNFDLTSPNWTSEGVTDESSFITWLENRTPNNLTNVVVTDFIIEGDNVKCNMTADGTLVNLGGITATEVKSLGIYSGLKTLSLDYNYLNYFDFTIVPDTLTLIYLNNNQFTTDSYQQMEEKASEINAFQDNCTIFFGANINSINGTNLKAILESKNCLVYNS